MIKQIWRYLINTFEVNTEGSNVKMLSLVTDTHAKLNNEIADPDINVIFTAFDPFYDAYRQTRSSRPPCARARRWVRKVLAVSTSTPAAT